MATMEEVDKFLEHAGVKGMKWGVRKAEDSGGSAGSSKPKKTKTDKAPSAGKQRDMETKAARARLNEGKSVVRKLINMDSFGKPLGGRQVLQLNNKGNSPEDIAIASRMTRGQKVALGVVAGATIVLNVAARAR